MMDYGETIDILRNADEYSADHRLLGVCARAADAIEALLKENKELIEDRPEMVEADGHWEWRKPNGEVPCRACDVDDVLDDLEDFPTASPWHRVEEALPEPHRDVLVSGMEAINNSRVYKVMVNDNGTWRPTDYAPSIRWDYWMPIEPPKE